MNWLERPAEIPFATEPLLVLFLPPDPSARAPLSCGNRQLFCWLGATERELLSILAKSGVYHYMPIGRNTASAKRYHRHFVASILSLIPFLNGPPYGNRNS